MGKESLNLIGRVVDRIPVTARVTLAAAVTAAPLVAACSSGSNVTFIKDCLSSSQTAKSEVMVPVPVPNGTEQIEAALDGVLTVDVTGQNDTFLSSVDNDGVNGVEINDGKYIVVENGEAKAAAPLPSGKVLLSIQTPGFLTAPTFASLLAACSPTPLSGDAMWRSATNNHNGTNGIVFNVTANGVLSGKP